MLTLDQSTPRFQRADARAGTSVTTREKYNTTDKQWNWKANTLNLDNLGRIWHFIYITCQEQLQQRETKQLKGWKADSTVGRPDSHIKNASYL